MPNETRNYDQPDESTPRTEIMARATQKVAEPEIEPEPEAEVEVAEPEAEPEAEKAEKAEEAETEVETKEEVEEVKAAEPKVDLIAGKFKSAADLEKAYTHSERKLTSLAQALQQAQYQVQVLRESIAQAQTVPSTPPRYEHLPPNDRAQIEQEAEMYGVDPNVILYQRWEIQRSQARTQQELATSNLQSHQTAWTAAAERVADYATKLDEYADHASATFDQYPELFETLRGMSAEATERFGRHYIDLLAASAELERMKKDVSQKIELAKRQGRDEASRSRDAKTKAQVGPGQTVGARTQGTDNRASVVQRLRQAKQSAKWD